jgi:hypothetical protein
LIDLSAEKDEENHENAAKQRQNNVNDVVQLFLIGRHIAGVAT